MDESVDDDEIYLDTEVEASACVSEDPDAQGGPSAAGLLAADVIAT